MKILSVDDSAENLYLIEMIVRAHGHEVVSARNGVEALKELGAQSFDLIVSDILMPQMDGFQLCRTVKSDERLKRIPLIFYTATYTTKQDEELGLALGASRFIIKPVEPQDFLALVEQVVEERERGETPIPDVDLDDEGRSLSLYNERLVRKLERKIEQLEAARADLAASIEEKNAQIAHRRAAEESLSRSEEQLRLMWEASMDGMVLTDREGTILRANRAFARIFARPLESLPGQIVTSCYAPSERDMVLNRYRERIHSRGAEPHFETMLRRWDGEQLWVEGSSATIDLPAGPALFTVFRDVSRQKLAEQERSRLEEQLRQAQKLESIGRLAGGVAHDFNNLLTVINGYTDMAALELPPDSPLHSNLAEIRSAGERAAELTRQLLALSRRQLLQPRVVALNTLITNSARTLKRLLREDIQLNAVLDPATGHVRADPGQIDQVIMNLAVNARDAMPHGGVLTLETRNVMLDEEHARRLSQQPGAFVMLSITDTGSGMDADTLARIFEPFFTTKELGKGTGLGLSTVYGIVKQSGGSIWVDSLPGRGTEFRIYLPRTDEPASEAVENLAQPPGLLGSETVLVVEDEESVRKLTCQALRRYGYRVIEAANGGEALLACEKHPEAIPLMVTDVIMPHMSGHDLAARLNQLHPEMQVLFMSGYTDDAVVHYDLQNPAVYFVQKPFAPSALVQKVRQILDSQGASGAL